MTAPADYEGKVAIVGAGVRVPGAADTATLWRLLRDGHHARTDLTEDQLRRAKVDADTVADPNYVRAGYVIDDIDRFDAEFFGIRPREADILDPQHRILLECGWQALESAGYAGRDAEQRVGVFAGSFFSTYLLQLYSNPEILAGMGELLIRQSNDKDYLATRLAYLLDLHGPAASVQTSCSTSLVATHLACQSLLGGECDVALAGGVSIDARQESGYQYQPGGILSPDGFCRAFDEGANGTVFGNGCVVVALRRLEDAIAGGDHIHAVILGSAINNDGASKVSFTAPSVRGQAEAIAEALAVADVDAGSIGYVECHGTGTPLGDPIEISALTDVYRQYTPATSYCSIGTAKTNFGHLGAASGALGLLKAALALQHQEIPPSLHFRTPNPAIDFPATPFRVNDRLVGWRPEVTPLRAGVSSFGMGGTNAHMVLEQAPPRQRAARPRRWSILLASARTPTAVNFVTRRLAAELDTGGDDLADTAFSTQVGRRGFAFRRAVVAADRAEAAALLRAGEKPSEAGPRQVVFLFPGQGSQHIDMARGIYGCAELFRSELDRCLDELQPHVDEDLRGLLLSPQRYPDAATRLTATNVAQPALFAVEYALARQLVSWGVRPVMMAGHSVGEWVAACLCGVFDLPDAAALVSQRGKLLNQVPPGAMLAVNMAERELAGQLDDAVVAAINGPAACTVAGPLDAIQRLENRLRDDGVRVRRLRTTRAFHSPMVEPVLEEFRATVRDHAPRAPTTPFLSNVTGKVITAREAGDPEYWVRQVRHPVRFHDMMSNLDTEAVAVEVGPGRALSALTSVSRPDSPQPIPTLGAGAGDPERGLGEALAAVWTTGGAVDWQAYQAGRDAVRVPLPTYPFERQRHWISSGEAETSDAAPSTSPQPQPVADWSAETIEAEVTAAWTMLMGEPPKSRDEDFFAVGGDSLLAVQMVSRLRTTFDCELPLEEVFDRRTVAELTDLLAVILLGTQSPEDDLEVMLREIEGMSEVELKRELYGDTSEIQEEPGE